MKKWTKLIERRFKSHHMGANKKERNPCARVLGGHNIKFPGKKVGFFTK
jgi:hypothetical protein